MSATQTVYKNNSQKLTLFPQAFCDKEKMLKNLKPEFVPIVRDGNDIRFECNVDVVATMLDNDALVQNIPEQNVTFDGDALFLYGSKGFFNL